MPNIFLFSAKILCYDLDMKNIIFMPILKTKQRSERTIIKNIESLYNFNAARNNIYFYIEVLPRIKDSEQLDKHFLTPLNDYNFIIEFKRELNESIIQYIDRLKRVPKDKSSRISICLMNNELIKHQQEVTDLIDNLNKSDIKPSIRITSIGDLDSLYSFFNSVSIEFIILDIDTNTFESLEYSISLKELKKHTSAKIIVFSNERPLPVTAKSYERNKFTNNANYTVLDAIKNDSFEFDGFGSYCSAKNDFNQEGFGDAYGILLTYSFDKNKFFVYRTSEKKHISKIYTDLFPIIKKAKEDNLLNGSLLISSYSHKVYDNLESTFNKGDKNLICSSFITLSIAIYIEQILSSLY